MPDIDIKAIEDKLVAARTKLILDKPFLGALVLRLPLQIANPAWCPTTGTDARKFYYNPEYVQELRTDEAQFVLAHEALHCALSHFARRAHRVKHRWDLACDYAINPILIADGLKPPPGMIMMKEYVGMSAEEIYPLLDDNDMTETMDQHLYDKETNPNEGSSDKSENPLDNRDKQDNPTNADDTPEESDTDTEPDNDTPPQQPDAQDAGESGEAESQPQDANEGDGNTQQQSPDEPSEDGEPPPPPLNQQEAEDLSVQWQQRLAGAAQQAQQAGKLSGVMKRLVEELLQPRLPWRTLLAHYMTAVARDDYSYARPSSRRGDPAIFPTLKSYQINAVVALDVSGSVNDKELQDCLSEINAIKGQVRAAVTLLACDSEVVEGFPRRFEPWEEATLPQAMPGGGSTDFRPVFEWVQTQDQQPDILVYFTDAQGYFPKVQPNYPVIWLVKGKSPVPWGTRVQLN
ncbi:VWA-like domain [Thiothrix caldifontis]|uniref:VWA-like domain n=1 Tax=Thiothrix caldifontis TaxID=525918 RepID=A0A1H4DKH8_9GAMM|nr:VWA-like domain-containing protein [Thiothrix caldifontis]SEA73087.1 VWA-like domain [Thiothrix caldifontis]